MKPEPFGRDLVDEIAQPSALLVGADPARHADLRDVRHEHAVAAGQRDVAGDPRALEADRILDDLARPRSAPGLQQLLDLAIRELLARSRDPRRGTLGRLVARVVHVGVLEQLALVPGPEHVGDVEERGALDLGAEVDERRLHAGEDPRHLAAIDVSDDSSITFALDKELSQGTLFDDRHADLGSLGIDHEHVLH